MKKTLVTAAALLTVVSMMSLTSCQKETADGAKQFRASMEGIASDDGKTTLEGTALNWISGDQVAIYGTAGRGIFSASPLTPATTAELVCEEGFVGSATYRAFYPTTITTDGVNVTLPEVHLHTRIYRRPPPCHRHPARSAEHRRRQPDRVPHVCPEQR